MKYSLKNVWISRVHMNTSSSMAGQSELLLVGKKKKVETVTRFSVTGDFCVGKGTACISVTSKVKNLSALKQLSRSQGEGSTKH